MTGMSNYLLYRSPMPNRCPGEVRRKRPKARASPAQRADVGFEPYLLAGRCARRDGTHCVRRRSVSACNIRRTYGVAVRGT